MDELMKSLQLGESVSNVVTVWSVIFGCGLAAILGICIGWLYRKVQLEASYSQSLIHTYVLLTMITALIMLIIGSNIARAFSLVGALSIIRFRTVVKDTKDTAEKNQTPTYLTFTTFDNVVEPSSSSDSIVNDHPIPLPFDCDLIILASW